MPGKYMPRMPRVVLVCSQCGREFSAAYSAVARGRHCCSRSCANSARSAKLKGHVKSAETRARISAAQKGVAETEAARLANSRAQTGKRMSDEAKRKIGDAHRGPKHWAWKGGIAKIGRFSHPGYYDWQAAVFARDDYTCQECGYHNRRAEQLNAHHVKPWADFPELRFHVANGITLCRECHWRLHGKLPRPCEPVYCACGCGMELDPNRVALGTRYCVGHNQRGRPRPESEREAISRALKGRPRTPEARANIAAALRQRAQAHPLTGWAKKFDRCIECGGTEAKHAAKGLCQRCYKRKRYAKGNPDVHIRGPCRISSVGNVSSGKGP